MITINPRNLNPPGTPSPSAHLWHLLPPQQVPATSLVPRERIAVGATGSQGKVRENGHA